MSSDSVVYHKLSKIHTYIHTYEKGAKKEPPDACKKPYIRGLRAILVEGANAYHYLLVVQTNSGTRGKPIVVYELTTIGYCYEPIVVHASTNTGRPTDLYWGCCSA